MGYPPATVETRSVNVGYPKTGTSALQNAFFPRYPEMFRLNPDPSEEDCRRVRDTLDIDILTKDSLTYSAWRVDEVFAPLLLQADSGSEYKAVGISNEELSYSMGPKLVDG